MAQEFEGVKIIKSNGNQNRQGFNYDSHMAMVIYSPAFPAGLNAGDVVEAFVIEDIEAVGIDAAFDANNTILAHYHAEEYFKYAPEGKLFLILTDQQTAAAYFGLAGVDEVFKTISSAKRIGWVYNGEPVALDFAAELAAAQAFIAAMATDHYLIDGIYLEGRAIGAAGVDLRLLNAPNCHAVIAQDPAIAVIDAAYGNYAAVGSVLGMRAVRNPNEHLGSTDIIKKPDYAKGDKVYPLTNPAVGRWLTAALSDGTTYASLSAGAKDQLTDRGYIYAGDYSNFPGIFFNGEPTCVDIASDYAWGENNNIWNKAARAIRLALLPKVKSQVKVDPATGFIRNTSAKYLEGIARKPVVAMITAEEISGAEVTIPTNQAPNDQNPLKVYGSLTRNGIVHLFEFTLGLK